MNLNYIFTSLKIKNRRRNLYSYFFKKFFNKKGEIEFLVV